MTERVVKNISDLDCYLVGGTVRDNLLNIKSADRDWVVVGANENIMRSLGFKPIGKGFPVFLHPDTGEEYALARTERKVGKGYKGFEVDTSESVTLEKDLLRRDLTINAMACDTQGNLIDPFGGQIDLENGLLRHVSNHFVEDPLRVLRVARFAARFHSRGFIVEDSTLQLMRELALSGELHHLVAERVWQEVKSALSENSPAVFFKVLYVCDALKQLFPEVHGLFRVESSIGSVINYLNLAADLSNDIIIRFAVLAYLIGKYGVLPESKTSAVDTIGQLCERLKTAAHFRKLAQRVVADADRLMTINETPAEQTVDLILSLDGLRNENFFIHFLNACSVIFSILHTDDNQVDTNIKLIRTCKEQMKQAEIRQLANEFKGSQLRDKVRLAYVEQVSKVLGHADS